MLPRHAHNPPPHYSVSHRAPRDASTGQDMMDEHYNFAVQGTLGRMPWPANQTLAADVMLKGKARYVFQHQVGEHTTCALWFVCVTYNAGITTLFAIPTIQALQFGIKHRPHSLS